MRLSKATEPSAYGKLEFHDNLSLYMRISWSVGVRQVGNRLSLLRERLTSDAAPMTKRTAKRTPRTIGRVLSIVQTL